jgi:hypothetical protein
LDINEELLESYLELQEENEYLKDQLVYTQGLLIEMLTGEEDE